PNQALVRTTTRAVAMRGTEIPAGCPVALNFLSANFDAEVLDRPDEFDATRQPNRHLAFGLRPHARLARAAARLQGRIVLDAFLDRTAGFAVDGPVRWAQWIEYGVAELWLRLDQPG